MKKIREVSPYLVSYNIEMAEVTGGTFWKEYTEEQISGKGDTSFNLDLSNGMQGLDFQKFMQYYPPINLYDEKLRLLATSLGPCWIRVSGSWATRTYFDLDGKTNGNPPEGFDSVLTKEQWIGVLDFVRYVDGKLLISVANCEGIHSADEPWDSAQAKLLFDFSKDYGVPIEAAEFMNEPNMLSMSGAPEGYSRQQFVRDQDLFFLFIKENYPEVLLVGPCSMCPAQLGNMLDTQPISFLNASQLMEGSGILPDVFSYHCYNGPSRRLEFMGGSWSANQATSDEYLNLTGRLAKRFVAVRDGFVPNAPMWVTESADAGGGGSTWSSTYLDVFRTLTELGSFARITDGVIFHNTLASSDYGLLSHGDFEPRPNYYALLLWNRLMGTTVYDANSDFCKKHFAYIHSRKDGKVGYACLIVNNSLTDSIDINLPHTAERYTLSAETLQSKVMLLNGKPLTLGKKGQLPKLKSEHTPAGKLTLSPAICTFLMV